MLGPSAELIGPAPNPAFGWLLRVPKAFPPGAPPNKLPPGVLPDPNVDLFAPPNNPPELLFEFVPLKPPKADDEPAEAAVLPNILPLLAVLLPKVGLLAPNGFEVFVLEPKPVPETQMIISIGHVQSL